MKTLTTSAAINLLQELIAAGILPLVMILQRRDTENHFQSITYDQDRYKCYNQQYEGLLPVRNAILQRHGMKALDGVPYDAGKTLKAAARELKARASRTTSGHITDNAGVSDISEGDSEGDVTNMQVPELNELN